MGTLQFGSWVQWFLRRVSRSHGTWVSYCEFVVILSSFLLLKCFKCSLWYLLSCRICLMVKLGQAYLSIQDISLIM
jgi:hypothetical protein